VKTIRNAALIGRRQKLAKGTELASGQSNLQRAEGTDLTTSNNNREWPFGFKGIVGMAACVVGLAVVYFGYGIGTESPKKDALAEVKPAKLQTSKKPVRSMNLALGNMVYFARDLGFIVKSAHETGVDSSKIAARIENQLNGIRQLYRQEVSKTPALAGTLAVQFNIAPSGEVHQVREVSSRLASDEFRKAVLAEASQWSFREIVTENLQVTCTLLFVHEGMDITTIVQWEKAMVELSEKPGAQTGENAGQHLKAHTAVPGKAAAAAQRPPANTDTKEFQIKYATALRKDPNFTSVSLATFTTGTKVTVLSRQGDWLQIVRSSGNGPTGFVRKEFVVPVDVARN
jgi:hypothetical protein